LFEADVARHGRILWTVLSSIFNQRVPLEMPEPDHLALEQRRAAALAGATDDLAGLADAKEIGAVDKTPGRPKPEARSM
jgi:hypothetical protein